MNTLMGRLCGQGPSCIRPQLAAKLPEPLPVVDLRHLIQNSAGRYRVIEDIGKACRELGCFQVINHDIDTSVMKGALEAASGFFEMPVEAKEEFASDDFTKPVRYETSSGDGTNKARAFLKHDAHPLGKWVQLWPLEPQGYRIVKVSRSWREVPQVPQALHVHIGDYLEVLSNGLYKGVVHRVVLNSVKQRISIASIQSLSMDEKVEVSKELLDEQRSKKYKESRFRDFLNYLSTKTSKEKRFIRSLKVDAAFLKLRKQRKSSFGVGFIIRLRPRTSDSLFSIHQEESKSLQDYVVHFNMIMLEVHNFDEAIVMSVQK
ncbi:putative 2-oxoglutarate-dependent dioxygenase0 [Cocos nucifera]|uniref:Putative 2-oxoglutarate-dependent dioxygenase0 n=1 Tax=Cocos nucifera TaxID=13894 RepID=A0A8K0IJD9_COCNU|nr:putative 2-oxoglutarate-dependent dioxygenase0 [Cocos nucifera]